VIVKDSVLALSKVVTPAESFGVTVTVVVSSAFAEADVADHEKEAGAPATVQVTLVDKESASGTEVLLKLPVR